MQLPDSPWRSRLEVAVAAVRAAGAALMELRGTITGTEADGGQLKTSTDLAAEGWVLGFLRGAYPDELYLAEEAFETAAQPWPGAQTYWTVDALDGTRSYVEGYAGFCVQVAFIENGEPVLGVIGEPVTGAVYVAAKGAGAWKLTTNGTTRLRGSSATARSAGLRFIDSIRPGGVVGRLVTALNAQFVECGSCGLKIARIVEDAADFYAKRFNYKLWDVAPGEVLLRETGGRIGSWQGEAIDYAATRTHFETMLVAPTALYDELVASDDFSE